MKHKQDNTSCIKSVALVRAPRTPYSDLYQKTLAALHLKIGG